MASLTSPSRWPVRFRMLVRSLSALALAGTVGVGSAVLPLSSSAQVTPFLVKDINTDDPAVSTSPQDLVTIGDTTYFSASTLATGRELWRTDGTEAGTVPVVDLWPGPTDSWPHGLTEIDGELWFAARSPGRGLGFWKSDGTSEGTLAVGPSLPNRWAFRAGVALDQGWILLTNDETELMDLRYVDESEKWRVPIQYPLASSDGKIESLVTTGTQAFFDVSYKDRGASRTGAPTRAPQVAVTDGTGEGTRQVTGFVELTLEVRRLTAAGSRAFFVADRSKRSELWTSDGTIEGTTRLLSKKKPKEIGLLVDWGGTLYFQLITRDGWSLWRSDGTRDGTVPVQGVEFGEDERTRQLVVRDDRLYFDLERPGRGTFLWRTDGTKGGTGRVARLKGSGKLAVVSMKDVGPWLALSVRSREKGEDDGHRLWVSDGTRSGTVAVADGTGEVPADRLTVLDDRLLFVPQDPTVPQELWITDGRAGDARQLARPVAGAPSSDPGFLTVHDGALYFAADDGKRGRELWRSDGTEEGTRRVADLRPGHRDSDPRDIVSTDGQLFFTVKQKGSEHRAIWLSDGTEEGTRPVRARGRASDFEVPDRWYGFAGLGRRIFYETRTSDGKRRLWSSDGTGKGTKRVPRAESAVLSGARVFEGRLCFGGGSIKGDRELWCSDGTRSGTERIADIYRGDRGSSPWNMAVAGGRLVMAAYEPIHGRELWTSDGTQAGTRLLADLEPDADVSSSPSAFAEVGDLAYFHTTPWWQEGFSLRRTDGTESGTVLLRAFLPGTGAPQPLGGLPGLFFFDADDGEHGRELWVSDGTPEGTSMLADLNPGPAESLPRYGIEADGRLIFRARGPSGDQIWISDGTAEGTVPVLDFTPDFQLWGASRLGLVGDLVYFVAETDEHGRELWAFSIHDLP